MSSSTSSAISDANYLLKRLLTFCSEEAFAHRWIWEDERWKELAFALLTRSTAISEPDVRFATDQLETLGLLRVSELAMIIDSKGKAHLEAPLSVRIIDLLENTGFSAAEARVG